MSRVLTVVALCALSLSLVFGSSAALAKPAGGNNSGNAKQCQKGGYTALARSTDPYTAFTTEKACTSYAANGGSLVAHIVPPRIEVTFGPVPGPWCVLKIAIYQSPNFVPIEIQFSTLSAGVQTFTVSNGGLTREQIMTIGETVLSVEARFVGGPVIPLTLPPLPAVCID